GGKCIGIPEIRRRLALGKIPNSEKTAGSDVRTSAVLLAILQARQLQRLAIEAMMLWVERSLSVEAANAKSTGELVAAADSAAKQNDSFAAAAKTTGEYLALVESLAGATGWPAAAALPKTDIVELMDRLSDTQRQDLSQVP